MDYYLYKNDHNVGPLTESEVIDGLKKNRFSLKDLACRVGEDKWQELEVFFLHIGHSWMEDQNSPPPGSSYKQPTQTPPVTNYETNKQSNFQNPIHNYSQPPQIQHVVHHYEESPEGTLPTVAMVGGIVAASLMVVALIPCLGWLNWLVIPLAIVMKVVCWVSIFTVKNSKGRNKALIGLILVALALFIGGIRLALGGGCI